MLSGYAYFPPVETVITPHTEMAVLASLAPQRRRRPYSKLRPHVGVVYPPPVTFPPVETTVQTSLVAVARAASPPRRALYLFGIRTPQFVGAPVMAVETTVRTHLDAAHSSLYPPYRRHAQSVLGKPLYVVAAPQAAMGGIGVWLAPQARPRTMSFLSLPPMADQPFIEDHLRIVLVINRRGR